MNRERFNDLPWDELIRVDEIPWEEMNDFYDRLPDDPDLWKPLLETYRHFRDTYFGEDAKENYDGLYALAILAKGFHRLPPETQKEAAEALVEELVKADELEDDFLLDLVHAACGSLGPAVLPAVMTRLEKGFDPDRAGMDLLALTEQAAKSQDPFLRRRVEDYCTRIARDTLVDRYDPETTTDALGTLIRLGAIDPQDPALFFERLGSEPLPEKDRDVLKNGIGFAEDIISEQNTDVPVDQWVKEFRQEFYDLYHDTSEEDETDYDDEVDPQLDRANQLANEFEESPAAGQLSPEAREHVGFAAGVLLEYAWNHIGIPAEDLDRPALEELLLDIFPRKISAEPEFFRCLPEIVAAFLHWLKEKGILKKDPEPLAAAVIRWRDRIFTASQNPANWGPAKGLFMDAQDQGVDVSNQEEFDRYIAERNLQLLAPQTPYNDEEFLEPVQPIVNAGPKIGRNEPCPCGSGKKYKKCCGKNL